ncbi:PREDICTED: vomeronasal type-2 receptor 26-like [Nanorana parkeri]|uniref:vomeronasal type-2 receptor 26-like n=1 Tax=Nanorana parkeri TaxID=125878 RepID=UPI00085472E5|nr:PREDICTED: vomeronasal type-2 receptor 26-like [Nanorana parkeri]
MYAIEEINKNPSVLPNVTLGFDIFDSCAYESKAVESILKVLTGSQNAVPNYQCAKRGALAGIIGHMLSSSTKIMAKISGVYNLPQVSYGVQDSYLGNTSIYSSLFRTVPTEQSQYDGFVQLLKCFGWTWVGIITTDDENNLRGSNDIKNILIRNGVCIAYFQIIASRPFNSRFPAMDAVKYSSANVVLAFLTGMDLTNFMYSLQEFSTPGKVWLIPSTVSIAATDSYLTSFNGSLAFAIHKGEIPGLKEFIYSANPLTFPDDIFTAAVWRDAFFAVTGEQLSNSRTQLAGLSRCGQKCSAEGYCMTSAVSGRLSVGGLRRRNVIDEKLTGCDIICILSAISPESTELALRDITLPPRLVTALIMKLNKYLKNVNFETSSGDNFHFENRGTAGEYDIMNWYVTPNKTTQFIQIGSYISFAPPGKQLVVDEKLIQWHPIFKEVPHSVCSNSCLPGYRKALRKSQQTCCYDCVLCSEGEISNSTDMENCIKCTEHQWSNERRDKCISRTIDFLSYEDALGIALSLLAVVLSALTVAILSIFIKHKETPIVKANNRDLSYILLLSLTLCFLCSLLFIGRPHTITCLFRQAAFGIIFAIAVSSVLAKTITVVIAFNAAKPGSESRKWMKARISTYLVCICAMGEVVICFVCFFCNPPFPDFDTSERSLKMTLQCNEGSSVAFYFLIGYMGVLAVFSFIVAFLARKLPDTFNEATHITFSMLVFCSVWLSFFPAYLSTKGKYMVAVEIFSILASSGGLLCCIFLPKCYIIIIRPELNAKERLIEKKVTNYNVERN